MTASRLPGIATEGVGGLTESVFCGLDWLTFFKVPRACLYACRRTRHAPEIDWIVEKKSIAIVWKENVWLFLRPSCGRPPWELILGLAAWEADQLVATIVVPCTIFQE